MEQRTLFEVNAKNIPLASRLRPTDLDNYLGQQHLLGKGKILRQLIEQDLICSMIFWGPPGTGKTTLAKIIANKTKAKFIDFSATNNGIKEIRTIMTQAEHNLAFGEKTIIFIDEIHRFNKAQQDAFLPFVENGSITLIGATTENPSFEINSALLSRCKVFVLKSLTADDLVQITQRALSHYKEAYKLEIDISRELMFSVASFANGDARTLLNTLDMIVNSIGTLNSKVTVTEEIVGQCISKKFLMYDKNGEEHYNLISALHKSMRNSDADAAVYWLARMLEGGEDPLYIARRVVRFASEDIGMANSQALEVAVAAFHACHFIGVPECNVHLTHAVVFCSLAPKSNALYLAYKKARNDALKTIAEPVPLVIRNAPTKLMKDLDYGKDYQYAHDTENKVANMQCLPDNLLGSKYYLPTNQGKELKIKKWMEELEALRNMS